MAQQPTITSAEMRGINRSAILELIRLESPIARTTIAQRLGVSLPTVMRIAEELIADGFVRPHGGTEWSGGRRRPLLEFNADGYIVLGIDLGGTKMYGAVSDLGGRILDEIPICSFSFLLLRNLRILLWTKSHSIYSGHRQRRLHLFYSWNWVKWPLLPHEGT